MSGYRSTYPFKKKLSLSKKSVKRQQKNFKIFFVNQGTKLYVIMQFILKSQKSFNPAFK